jgi:hypothetical protein
MDTEKFVFATYYRYTALFHLKQDHYAEFYHYSLQFLAYVDQEVNFWDLTLPEFQSEGKRGAMRDPGHRDPDLSENFQLL